MRRALTTAALVALAATAQAQRPEAVELSVGGLAGAFTRRPGADGLALGGDVSLALYVFENAFLEVGDSYFPRVRGTAAGAGASPPALSRLRLAGGYVFPLPGGQLFSVAAGPVLENYLHVRRGPPDGWGAAMRATLAEPWGAHFRIGVGAAVSTRLGDRGASQFFPKGYTMITLGATVTGIMGGR